MDLVGRETTSRDAEARREAVEAVYATGYWLLARERVAEAAMALRLMVRAEPNDERGWLGLGECHERTGQPHIALELYGAGSVAASREGVPSIRCLLARARVLRFLDRDEEADAALAAAASALQQPPDEALSTLLAQEHANHVRKS